MAEFCVQCWKELNEMDVPENNYVLSKTLELCEGCGQWRPIIIKIRRPGPLTCLFQKLKRIFQQK